MKSYNMNMICHFSFIINDFYAKCKILVKGGLGKKVKGSKIQFSKNRNIF